MSRSTRTDESSNPTPSSDHVSAEAPGVRTEAEVVADEQAAQEAAADAAPAGATGNPATAAELREQAKEAKDGLVHFRRKSDGVVQSVDADSVEHGILVNDREWQETTRAKAKAAKPQHSDGFAAREAKANA